MSTLLRVLGTLTVVASSLAACGTTPSASWSGDPHRTIGLGEWCRTLTDISCDKLGRCVGSVKDANATCTTQRFAACEGGRDDGAPSGHDGGDLKGCADTLQSLGCDDYMGRVAAHTECAAASTGQMASSR
jgi:hypothetical protein